MGVGLDCLVFTVSYRITLAVYEHLGGKALVSCCGEARHRVSMGGCGCGSCLSFGGRMHSDGKWNF